MPVYMMLVSAAIALTIGYAVAYSQAPPTPEEYVAHVGGGAEVVPPGQLKLDNRRVICGQRPTVLDNQLDDYSAAYPGFIILNPKRIGRVSTSVKLWIHAHACGYQFRGPNSELADCFAVQRGRREGWLTPDGLEEVCRFIAPAKGDSTHFPGPYRCEYMRKCYADPTIQSPLPSPQISMNPAQTPTEPTVPVQPPINTRPPMPTRYGTRELTPPEIFTTIAPSVYVVVATQGAEAIGRGEGRLGSAVAVSTDTALTNCHVVGKNRFIALIDDKTNKLFWARPSFSDETSDRCILKIGGSVVPIGGVRPIASLTVGERVYTIGNPSGLSRTLGEGLISGLRSHNGITYIQTSASISPGSSGGALVDSKGALIGITTFRMKDAQNLNFAIAAEEFWR